MEEEIKENRKGKKYNKKQKKIIKIILIVLLVIIIVGISVVGIFIGGKLAKINFRNLDESELEINDNMYNEVSKTLTKAEYDNIINILLIGSDSKDMNDTYAGTSDCLMIISINPKYKSLKLISIPRDTAVDIDQEHGRYKINHAFAWGKEELALKTINKTFDLNLKEYITINISAMYDIINELGGVEVNITKDEMNWINEYVDMFYGFSGKPSERVTKYGKVTLTGEQAACHVKERMAGTDGDFGRTDRQREVFMSMLTKISQKDIGEISKVVDMILGYVTTNANIGKYMMKLPELVSNKNQYLGSTTSVMVPSRAYSKGIMVKGSYLFETNVEKAKVDFRKYMYEM